MTLPDYADIMPGLYADQNDLTLTVGERTPDGRFVVHHRHGAQDGAYVLSGRTIGQLYPRYIGAVAEVPA